MIDLLQLTSMQQTATEMDIKLHCEGQAQDAQGNADFTALMTQLLVSEEVRVDKATTTANKIMAGEEALNIKELNADLTEEELSSTQSLAEPKIQLNSNTLEKENHDSDISINANISLIEFDDTIFELSDNKFTINKDNSDGLILKKYKEEIEEISSDILSDLSKDKINSEPVVAVNECNSGENFNVETEIIEVAQFQPVLELKQPGIEIIDSKPSMENKNGEEVITDPKNASSVHLQKENSHQNLPIKISTDHQVVLENSPEKPVNPLMNTDNVSEFKTLLDMANPAIDENREAANTSTLHSVTHNELKGSASREIASPKTLNIPSSVSSSDWGGKFTQQVVWLGQQKIKTAIIKLNPQELGPLEVNIKLVKDSASINITAHTTQVRDLIEQNVPKLREMMSEQGINLSQVNIESNNHPRHFSSRPYEPISKENEADIEQALTTPVVHSKIRGIVDYFA
ncbi:flagellar hook-length control protein FliK [Legionella brunensis]|uniref:Putative flagellar hook-length control protein n=1 Tax=Legionella brunensis TaxID=29422 RepID=A0A0W0STL8_9GAMM|nr:flagellar hook-length control protein FliK [Legionella brunensis]KTC86604.1 putative flagellar hook-length control protein [Legionella brunensis]